MAKVIFLNTPIDTPLGKIRAINWNWKLKEKYVEYLPGTKKAEMKIGVDNKENILPVKIIPADNSNDATINPLQGKDMVFWIKQGLLEHLDQCDICLRYVIIHEFTHLLHQFQFPLPWELRGFRKKTMYSIHHYIIDSLIDKWNVLYRNYKYNDPIKFMLHMEKENNITLTTREELFENYIHLAKFASHCNPWKRHLYRHAHQFPHMLRDKYHKLIDALSGAYEGPEFPIYELVRDIAELMLCASKKDIMKRDLKRRFYTLSDIGSILYNERNNSLKLSVQQLWNKRLINIFQFKNCLLDWKRTFKRIDSISSDELKYIDEFLSEPTNQNMFSLSYFLKNDI